MTYSTIDGDGGAPLWILVAAVALTGGLLVAGCGGEDPQEQNSCSTHSDCEVGYACNQDGKCVQTACEDVPGEGCGEDELVCLETDKYPDGVCSRPECSSASDCDATGAFCDDGICKTEECSSDSECASGERCNAFGQCTSVVDTGVPDGGTDGGGDADPDTTTEPDADGVSDDGSSCPNPESCPRQGSPEADKWSSEYCACVECRGDSDCSESGEECRGGTCQPTCTKSCNSSKGGSTCEGTSKPYCINDCCVECIGKSDCNNDKLCVDGVCQDGSSGGGDGDCTSGSCPSGYTCNSSTGNCEQQSSGQSCSQQNPNCPQNEYCNQNTGMCEPVQGGNSCGGCNQGCTCPGNLTCDQQLFACTGCSAPFDTNCPTSNNVCFPLGNKNVCF